MTFGRIAHPVGLIVPAGAGGIAARGFEVAGNSPQACAARIEADIAKWSDVVRSAGIKAQQ